MDAYVVELGKHGFQFKIHAIGDQTVRSAIDVLEPVIRSSGGNPNREMMDAGVHLANHTDAPQRT